MDVTVVQGQGFTRYSVNVGGTLLEAWTYPARPKVYAVDCAPVSMLPGCAATSAILAAIWEREPYQWTETFRRSVALTPREMLHEVVAAGVAKGEGIVGVQA